MVFTGLVEAMGVVEVVDKSGAWTLRVTSPGYFAGVALGDSIAVNGCCLTAVKITDDWADFQIMAETRRLTTLAHSDTYPANLEKAMQSGARYGGHVVQGHVHGVATLVRRDEVSGGSDSIDFWFKLPEDVPSGTKRVVHKGSICIHGVSLTVAEYSPESDLVRVSIIPHTQKVTTFGSFAVGDKVNIEFDAAAASSATPAASPLVPAALPSAVSDEGFMMQAVAEGEKGRFTAPPNPWVGCVLVREGVVLSRGYHRKAGCPHAEVEALQALPPGVESAGATAYVTLEPCSHFGRTGPCCVALVEAGIKRCVIGCLDPDPRVSGKGVEHLRAHGVEVVVGPGQEHARRSLLPYLHQRSTGLPYVVLKIANTIDGCVACKDGTSQWITGPQARQQSHMIRAASQAVVVGSGTALADDPKLNVRLPGFEDHPQPLRVVLDRRGRVVKGALLDTSVAPTLIATTGDAPAESRRVWSEAGVEVFDGGSSLRDVLRELASRGILQVMVEGGAAVHTAFLNEGLGDRLVVFVGGMLFGMEGRRWLQGSLCETISDATKWTLDKVAQYGNDACLEYSRPPK